jgi:hypothetical protein
MATHGRRSYRDGALQAALLQGLTTEAAAKAAGVSERTAYRRTSDPGFQRELAQARARALSRALSVLVDGTAGAAAQLRWLATHAEQESIQLAACRSVLELALRGTELVDLVQEIAELREQVRQIVADREQVVGGGKQWRRPA